MSDETTSQVSRRRLLGVGAGAAVAGAVAGVGGAYAVSHDRVDARSGGDPTGTDTESTDDMVAFRGERQAGIVTPAQDRMHFVALDVVTQDRAALAAMLKAWTRAAERMTAGAEAAPGGVVGGGPYRAPEDTGEAYDLDASDLTITIGYGPSLFDDRFGLADRKPAALEELPGFVGDDLDPARSGGDLCIQACANDPQVAVHAVRNLVRMGFGVVAVRWSQLGFGRTSSTTRSQVTPRNMFGFKDGTNNLKAEDADALDEHVWVQPADVPGASAWMSGGSYLVARRIRMHIEIWDRTPLQEQQDIIGRDKGEGAPLGQQAEFDPLDFARSGCRRQARDPGRRPRGARAREPARTAYASCAVATTSPTARTESGTSTPGCSSSASCATPTGSSCRCSGHWRPRTASTSTSSTPARRSSPARRDWGPTSTGVRPSSPELFAAQLWVKARRNAP